MTTPNWNHTLNPYSVADNSRKDILYHGLKTIYAIDGYIDAIQAVEKDIDPDKVIKQIEIAYELRDIEERLEKVRKEIRENNIDASYR